MDTKVERVNMLARLFVLLLIIIGNAFGSTTGKVAGVITDHKTGDPLIGVNIVIKNTNLGATSDLSGYYVILNVSPGIHEVDAFMIGYANVKVTDVIVKINLTSNIDIQMETEVLSGSEVIVIADRPVVDEEISHSQLNITASAIETMPVTDVTDVIGLQAGVEGLSIRGGSASETSIIVDGFVMRDARDNTPYSVVSLSTVQEITVQTGGFNAEYANVRSGAINIITKEGRPDKYGGTISLIYQPDMPKHYGISPYDPNSYFLKPYLDPAVCWTGTSNGEPYEDQNGNGQWDTGEPIADYNNDGKQSAWDAYTQRQYPSFEGWNAISRRTLEDSNPDNDLTPEAAKKLFEWEHRRQGDIKKPDYTLDLNFGGPVPGISEALGNLRFNLAIRDVQDMYIFPLSRDAYHENQARIKLTSDLNVDTKLTLYFLYGEENSTIQYNWRPTPTGGVLRSDYTIANLISGEALFVPAYYSPTTIYRGMFGLKMSRVISSSAFYEITVQNKRDRYYSFQVDDRDSALYTPIPGYPNYFVDEAPYGYYGDDGINSIGDNLRIGGWMNLGRDRSIISATMVRFDFTSQINSYNQIRFGFNTELNNLNIKSYTSNPGMTTWNREQVYNVKPYLLGAYIYDKMEFKGLIANLSLRADLSNANTYYYMLDSFDSYFKAGAGYLIEDEASSEKSKTHLVLSPRIGISHPISVNSKLYFNYGHYRSEPSSTNRFRMQREYSGQVTDIGNPNLLLEKTVSYELGYSHNLFNHYLLNLAAYYKNIDNQVAWVSYQNINSSINYIKPENNHYEDIRGFEITIDKQHGDWLTGFINYTYMVNSSGYFDLMSYYENPTQQREYINTTTTQSRPVPRPYIRANIDLHTPDRFGLNVGGLYLLGGMDINLLASWKAGSYTDYNPTGAPGVSNNVQWRDSYNVNLRVAKDFKLNNLDMRWYVDITNLMDTKFLSYSGFANSQDYLAYMGSLHFDWEEGIEKGRDRIGEYRDPKIKYTPMRSININPLDLQELGVNYQSDGSGAIYLYEGSRIISVIDDGDGSYTPVFDESQSVKQYIRWDEESDKWQKVTSSLVNQLLEDKAYIDMPNIQSMTFLNPRSIKFGIQISF